MSRVHFVENTVITVLLWSWTVLKHDVSGKPKNCLIISQTSRNTASLLPTARDLSVTDRLRSANKLPCISAQTNTFKNSYLLLFKQFTVWTMSFLCVTVQSSLRVAIFIPINWQTDTQGTGSRLVIKLHIDCPPNSADESVLSECQSFASPTVEAQS